MKLIKAMATVAGMTGLSRIAGFARDVLTAAYLGAGPIADAFFIALKFPNFFRRVTAEGAFSIAFVPLYSKSLEKDGQEKADAFASNAFMIMLSFLSVITCIALILMPYIVYLIAPGFNESPEQQQLATEFLRITFPYLLLMSLSALLGGVLNAINKFAPFAFAPVLFNLSLIAAILMSDYFENVGLAMSYGVLTAGILQLAFLWVCIKRSGIKITWSRPRMTSEAKKVLKLMGPAVIGAGVVHINLFADIIIASYLDSGSISYLYYADRLNQLPLGVVGIAVGTALLPMLSRAMVNTESSEAKDLFNRALEACFILALPAAIALVVMPLTLVTVLFERGAFTAEHSQITANVLMSYAIGLPAYIAIKVFSTAHWAREDTKTPVKIAAYTTLLNVVMSIILVQFIGVIGIALSTGVIGWLQFYWHIHMLKDHSHVAFDDRFKKNIIKIITASAVMGGCVWILSSLFTSMIFGESAVLKITVLMCIVLAGAAIYGALILILGVVNKSDISRYIKKRKA